MKEIWKDIEGYEGLYQVSNLGRVKSLGNNKLRKEKLLKPFKNEYGYLLVTLCKNSKNKKFKIHRLVASVFIENPNNYEEINHIEECKTNNNVINLEWCNHKYNMNYGNCSKRSTEKRKKAIYCLENDTLFKSITECAKELNLPISTIINVLKGRQKQAKGYTFRYTSQILFIGGN